MAAAHRRLTVLVLVCTAASTAFAITCADTRSAKLPNCLELAPNMVVHWGVAGGNITFNHTTVAPGIGWMALGLSETGSMKGSDMFVVQQQGGKWTLTDMWATGFVRPVADKQQTLALLGEPLHSSCMSVLTPANPCYCWGVLRVLWRARVCPPATLEQQPLCYTVSVAFNARAHPAAADGSQRPSSHTPCSRRRMHCPMHRAPITAPTTIPTSSSLDPAAVSHHALAVCISALNVLCMCLSAHMPTPRSASPHSPPNPTRTLPYRCGAPAGARPAVSYLHPPPGPL